MNAIDVAIELEALELLAAIAEANPVIAAMDIVSRLPVKCLGSRYRRPFKPAI